jgi:hypothetical protein
MDGVNWENIGTVTINLPASVYVGLAVTSHTNAALCAATFDNVSISSW